MTSALVTDTERVGFVLNDDRLRRAARQSHHGKNAIPCEEAMQMDTSFKPGDVVQLNSGGPKMTVVSVQSDGTLRCSGSKKMASKTMGFLRKSRFALPKPRIDERLDCEWPDTLRNSR